MNNKDRWSQLSMQQRADLIKLYINNGVTSIRDIRNHYNSFGDGGDTNHPIEVQQGLQNGTIKAIKREDGTYAYIRQEAPLKDTTSEIMEWAPGVGDVYEAGQVVNDIKDKNYGSAVLGASLMLIPGNLGKIKSIFKGKKVKKAISEIDPRVTELIDDAFISDSYSLPEVPKYAFESKTTPVDEVRKVISQSNTPIDKEIISLINNTKVKNVLNRTDIEKYVIPERSNVVKKLNYNQLREALIKEGVDPELLTDNNLNKLIAARFKDYTESVPQNIGLRTTLKVNQEPYSKDVYEYRQFRPEGEVGYTYIYGDTPTGNKVGMVENITSGANRSRGVSEQAYNSVINDLGDITSGEYLLDADATLNVLSKYENKEIIGNFGTHHFKDDIRYNAPVYRMNTPTYNVPVKYLDEFGLEGLSQSGKFNVDFTKGPTYKNGGKLNKFATGGPTEEILNSNTNEPLITREEYLNRQRQAIINQSIENSNNRIQPAVPYIEKYKDQNDWEFQINDRRQSLLNLIDEATKFNWGEEHVNAYKSDLKGLEDEYNKGYRQESIPGATCIYTATDNYGKKYRVAGNKSFRSSPEKYGFTEINLNDIKPGDIIQDFSVNGTPTHALTFMGYSDEGKAMFNYSSGDYTEKAIKKNKNYPFYSEYGDPLFLNNEDNSDLRTYAAAYRFIGNNEDNNLWNQEYNDYRSNYTRNIVNQLKSVPKLPQPNVRQLSSLGIERKNVGKVDRFDEGGKIDIKYPLDATTGNGEKYSDIIMQREHDAYNALLRNGYSIEDARRLSPILTAQSLYETGWRLSDKNNNYAGYLDSKGNKLKYDSAEEFWDSHLKNLSNRWSSWDTARNVEDYYNIVNQTHLNLKSKEDYNRYKKDNPNTFIYSPTWENTDYKRRLLNTSARVQSYLDRLSMNKDFPLNNNTQPFIDKSLFPVEFLYK